jgi:hypothetical protein
MRVHIYSAPTGLKLIGSVCAALRPQTSWRAGDEAASRDAAEGGAERSDRVNHLSAGWSSHRIGLEPAIYWGWELNS